MVSFFPHICCNLSDVQISNKFCTGAVETFIIGAALSATSLGKNAVQHAVFICPDMELRDHICCHLIGIQISRSLPDKSWFSSRQRCCHRRRCRPCDGQVSTFHVS